MQSDHLTTNQNTGKSKFVSCMRIIAGFTLAPTLGALIFYLILNVPIMFGYTLPAMSLSTAPKVVVVGVMMAGTLFYAPVVIIGLAVMLIIHRFHSWSLSYSILGGILSAFILSFLMMAFLMLQGSGIAVAGGTSSIMLGIITIPSVISGISFWLIAAYKNGNLEQFFKTHPADVMQPAFAVSYVDLTQNYDVHTEDQFGPEYSASDGSDNKTIY